VFICVHLWFLFSEPGDRMSGAPRIVVPIIAGLGNSLMAMPMVRQIKKAFPDSHITILARNNAFAEMFRRMPEADEVLVAGLTFLSPKNLVAKLKSRWSDLRGFWRMIRWTRQRHADIYLVPFPSNRWHYSILALTSGAKRRILHNYPAGYWKALHFIGERTPAQTGIHDVVQNLRLLKMIGIEPDEREAPRFIITDADRSAAEKLLHSANVTPSSSAHGKEARPVTRASSPVLSASEANVTSYSSTPHTGEDARVTEEGSSAPAKEFIAVHAGSGSYTVIARAKRWDPKSYAELIAAMIHEHGKSVLLLEGPDESGVADSIVKHFPGGSAPPELRVLKLAGPLGVSAAILERASIYVGSDSGLAHLAASVEKRAVTIFAPADPDRVCPYGSRDLVVQTPNTCSPCFTYPFKTPYTDSKCHEPFCIDQVTVEQVLAAVRRGLSPVRPLPVASPQ
jgi:heptosyltransferase-2